mgnify:CR=1 FL=1
MRRSFFPIRGSFAYRSNLPRVQLGKERNTSEVTVETERGVEVAGAWYLRGLAAERGSSKVQSDEGWLLGEEVMAVPTSSHPGLEQKAL